MGLLAGIKREAEKMRVEVEWREEGGRERGLKNLEISSYFLIVLLFRLAIRGEEGKTNFPCLLGVESIFPLFFFF